MLAVVQAVAAQVGAVSKKGLEECVRVCYGRFWAFLGLLAVLAVNLLTLAADLEGGGAALQLLTHIDYRWWLVPLGGGTVALLIFGNYHSIEREMCIRDSPLRCRRSCESRSSRPECWCWVRRPPRPDPCPCAR